MENKNGIGTCLNGIQQHVLKCVVQYRQEEFEHCHELSMICSQQIKKVQLHTNRNMVSFEKSVNWYNHEHRKLWL